MQEALDRRRRRTRSRRDFLRASSLGFGSLALIQPIRLSASGARGSSPQVREIGSKLELFVDDWLIETMKGVELKLHRPVPREVVLEFDRPWEGPLSYAPVYMTEGDRYRLWYRGGGVWDGIRADRRPEPCTCYAESRDGIHWERPVLGIHEARGIRGFEPSRDNNIVIHGSTAKHVCVFKDGNPAAPESERYKAIGLSSGFDPPGTLRGLVSPDGLHWTVLDKDPILTAPGDDHWPHFDSHNTALWDPNLGQYVAYMRGMDPRFGVFETYPPGIRSIRRSVSSDFRNWSKPQFIELGDSPVEHLYMNASSLYYRASHLYLMFPKRFFPERKVREDWTASGISESVFMTSRDGVNWDRRFMEAFLRPGPDPDNWTDRNMYKGVGVVPTGPAEMSIYYIEHYRHPSVRLRRGALRIDGFASVNGPYSGGELLTRPLIFEGRELVLNCATSAPGSLRVEVQDVQGRPPEGFGLADCVEIVGDEIERVVTWRAGSDLGSLSGKPVRLRFAVKDADLYSIRFRM